MAFNINWPYYQSPIGNSSLLFYVHFKRIRITATTFQLIWYFNRRIPGATYNFGLVQGTPYLDYVRGSSKAGVELYHPQLTLPAQQVFGLLALQCNNGAIRHTLSLPADDILYTVTWRLATAVNDPWRILGPPVSRAMAEVVAGTPLSARCVGSSP